eukprot:TRINITY_DN62318_c2_g1_i3.p1 TRINITY_DN62318_c2_g1~~TRINITY_DN62318_c2_g1_i3.p1  ORF type:complete len:121 (+),score=34.26 TRINITY_DN62318_c2_g1_i3:337-699(+)
MTSNQIRAAQGYAQLARAREQVGRISADFNAYRDWLVAANNLIEAEIAAASSETSRYFKGLCHLLWMSKGRLEKEGHKLVSAVGQNGFTSAAEDVSSAEGVSEVEDGDTDSDTSIECDDD